MRFTSRLPVAILVLALTGLAPPRSTPSQAGSHPAFALRPAGLEENTETRTVVQRLTSRRAGLEELSQRAKALDARLRKVAARLDWLKPMNIDLNGPNVRFAVHLGGQVEPPPSPSFNPGSSSPQALTYLYNDIPQVRRALDAAGISTLVSLPLDTPLTALSDTLQAIEEHPRIVVVTATAPVKQEVEAWVQRWTGRVSARPRTNVHLERDAQGTLKMVTALNVDGAAFVAAHRDQLLGKKIVFFGLGGFGRAAVGELLGQRLPRKLLIVEKNPVGVELGSDVTVRAPDDPQVRTALAEAEVIINGAGSRGSPMPDPALLDRPAAQPLTVIEASYRPLVTPFLREAWNHGVRNVHNGLTFAVRGWAKHARLFLPQMTDAEENVIFDQLSTWARDQLNLRDAHEILAAGLEERAVGEVQARATVQQAVHEWLHAAGERLTETVIALGPSVLERAPGLRVLLLDMATGGFAPYRRVLVVPPPDEIDARNNLVIELSHLNNSHPLTILAYHAGSDEAVTRFVDAASVRINGVRTLEVSSPDRVLPLLSQIDAALRGIRVGDVDLEAMERLAVALTFLASTS